MKQGRSIIGVIVLILLTFFVSSGCSIVDTEKGDIADLGAIPKALVSVVTRPLTEFTVADAKATLSWVDQEAQAGNLSPAVAAQARVCPSSVLALYTYVKSLEDAKVPEGVKGLIYYATVRKYSARGKIEDQLKALALGVVTSCAPLVEVDSAMIRYFR